MGPSALRLSRPLLRLCTAHGHERHQGLGRQSGLLGVSAGRSSDTRELVAAAANSDHSARLALEVLSFRAREGLVEAAVCLDRVDAVVFTGEIGADQPETRQAICTGLAPLGVHSAIGSRRGPGRSMVSRPGARVPIVEAAVGEDLQGAAETRQFVPRSWTPSDGRPRGMAVDSRRVRRGP